MSLRGAAEDHMLIRSCTLAVLLLLSLELKTADSASNNNVLSLVNPFISTGGDGYGVGGDPVGAQACVLSVSVLFSVSVSISPVRRAR